MDIKEMVRAQLLREEKAQPKRLGCVMVYLDYDKEEWKKLQDIVDDEDIYINPILDYGREDNPHVTILYGLHADVSDDEVKEEMEKIKFPKIEIEKISSFNNKEFDVLKIDIKCPYLHELNKKFKKFPHTSTFPDYHPHVTLSYLKPKLADKYIKKLNEYVKENGELNLVPNKIVYSKANGDKIEHSLKNV